MKTAKQRARSLVGPLILSLLLGGCATSPQTYQLLENPPDLPSRVELTSVPFFPQQEYHCGPAALAGILNFRGSRVEPEQIAQQIYVPGLQGSLQAEVVAATRQYDMLPVQLDGRLESLLRELAAGNPVFVLQNLGLDSIPVWHYEIVIGYDFKQGELILRSGVNRRVARSFALFEKTWLRAGYWALVIVPAEQIPITASAGSYLDAVIDLEQVGRAAAAHRAYASALRRWPNNLLAHSGFANTAYTLGDFGTAESAYRAALTLDPERVDIWNNLAYALAAQGRREDSLAAIRRALELDPNNPNLNDSLTELINWN